MQIVWKNPAEIIPYDHNLRLNDSAIAAVAASIREFGFRQPIVVDAQWVIIAGHTRHKAAQRLGLESVPVVVAGDLTPDQIRAYRIADNKTGELAEWDFELLASEMLELTEAHFDGNLLGFSENELTKLLNSETEAARASGAHVNEACSGAAGRKRRQTPRAKKVGPGRRSPAVAVSPPGARTTRPGDVWLLGEHRLLCDDLGNPVVLDRLLDGPPVQLIEPDPLKCDMIVGHWERRTGRVAERRVFND